MEVVPKFAKPKDKPQRKRRNHSIRNKRRTQRGMVIDLDRIARLEVMERDGWRCVRCGSQDAVQWSHVHSRRHYCIRWDPENAKVLCVKCHAWWTYNPGLAYDWFRKHYPERWERITAVLQLNPKVRVRALWLERCAGEREK